MARMRRTEKIDLVFGVTDAMVEGWHFGVPPAYRDALDIKWTERWTNKIMRMVWTRGVPPSYGFAQGDIFYAPRAVRAAPWGDAEIDLAVQVREADPMLDPDENAQAGRVVFDLWRGRPGVAAPERYETTQTGFADVLRTGRFENCRKIS